jgi:signal transduction histidine kinase
LRASLEEILQSIERDHSVSFSLEDHLLDQPHSLLAVGLHRIAREALVNVTKHAQASHVDVTLTRLNGGIQITIADDGIGFGVGEVRGPEHIGISTMEARAHAMAGELQIHSRVGAGTRVEVWVPDPSQRRTSNAE